MDNVYQLIEQAKTDGKKSITVDVLDEIIVVALKAEGYGVYWFKMGNVWVVSWSMKTGQTSGKISIPTILKIMEGLKNIRNILCSIL